MRHKTKKDNLFKTYRYPTTLRFHYLYWLRFILTTNSAYPHHYCLLKLRPSLFSILNEFCPFHSNNAMQDHQFVYVPKKHIHTSSMLLLKCGMIFLSQPINSSSKHTSTMLLTGKCKFIMAKQTASRESLILILFVLYDLKKKQAIHHHLIVHSQPSNHVFQGMERRHNDCYISLLHLVLN